jgi:hypothetical protein
MASNIEQAVAAAFVDTSSPKKDDPEEAVTVMTRDERALERIRKKEREEETKGEHHGGEGTKRTADAAGLSSRVIESYTPADEVWEHNALPDIPNATGRLADSPDENPWYVSPPARAPGTVADDVTRTVRTASAGSAGLRTPRTLPTRANNPTASRVPVEVRTGDSVAAVASLPRYSIAPQPLNYESECDPSDWDNLELLYKSFASVFKQQKWFIVDDDVDRTPVKPKMSRNYLRSYVALLVTFGATGNAYIPHRYSLKSLKAIHNKYINKKVMRFLRHCEKECSFLRSKCRESIQDFLSYSCGNSVANLKTQVNTFGWWKNNDLFPSGGGPRGVHVYYKPLFRRIGFEWKAEEGRSHNA